VVNNPADGDVWREAAREELRQVIDDLLHTEKTHMAAAERLGKVHRRLGLISTALATLGGATILADQSELAAGLLTLGAALGSGVLTFMTPDKVAEQHLGAGRQLGALRVRARHILNLDTNRLDVDALRGAVDAIAEDKAKIDATAPGTEAKDYKVARNRIMAGTFERD